LGSLSYLWPATLSTMKPISMGSMGD
jgi:hypothetical protein